MLPFLEQAPSLPATGTGPRSRPSGLDAGQLFDVLVRDARVWRSSGFASGLPPTVEDMLYVYGTTEGR